MRLPPTLVVLALVASSACKEVVDDSDTDPSPSEADTDVDADSDTDADTDADTDSDTDSDADSDTDADTDADADSDTDTDTDSDADSDTDATGDTGTSGPTGATGDTGAIGTAHTGGVDTAPVPTGDTASDTGTAGPPDFPDLPDDAVLDEPGWTLTRRVPLTDVWSVAWAPDGRLYATRRASPSNGGGVYEVVNQDLAIGIGAIDRPAGLAVDDVGRLYVSEDFDGRVTRIDTDGSTSTWLSTLGSGDDDPAGMDFVWPGKTDGSALGTGFLVDRGVNGTPDALWSLSSIASDSETLLLGNSSSLVNPIDVAVGSAGLFVADLSVGDQLWSYDTSAAVPPTDATALTLTPSLTGPSGISTDVRTDTLVVADTDADGAYRVDPATGAVTPILTGYGASGWSNVEVDPSGLRIALSATDEVLVLSRCDPAESEDCDGNGRADVCDLELDPGRDCDDDGRIDSCAIADGDAEDCDGDGRIDTCADCPPIDIVFLVDHSSSMTDEGAALCDGITDILALLDSEGYGPQARILGLNTAANGTFPCLEDSVTNAYGTAWPGTPPTGIGTDYLDCPGGNQVPSESWGSAVALAASNQSWRPGALRLVVPLGDEGPWCGDPVGAADDAVIPYAADLAVANDVIVSPLTGTGSSAAVLDRAVQLAGLTGGSHSTIGQAETELAGAIIGTVELACQDVWDCDSSGRSDACELLEGAPDCDGNGRLDTCDVASGTDPGVCDTGETGL